MKIQRKLTLQYVKRLREVLPGAVHYNFHLTGAETCLPCSRGQGARVFDIDGNEYLDLFCKFGALITGHAHPEYTDALRRAFDKALSVDIGDIDAEVCERIVRLVPSAEMVRFSLSGTEAVQNAIRLARAYSGKPRFVRFVGHYHGNSDNIMGGVSHHPAVDHPVEDPGDHFGTEGRAPGILEAQSFLIPWNDVDAFSRLLEKHGDQIGAVIMEPICINGGGILPKEGYLQAVRDLCDRHGIVLIFDEVITGFRVAIGGVQSLTGVTPDLTVFGKAMAGGVVPVSAIAGKKEIMSLYTQMKVVHAGTFNGYPLGMAAVNATLELLERNPDCYMRMGGFLTKIGQLLVEAARERGIPLSVQGVPTALVFHTRATPVARSEEIDTDQLIRDNLVTNAARHHGILFSPVSRMYCNLMFDAVDLEFFQERIDGAFEDAKDAFDAVGADF